MPPRYAKKVDRSQGEIVDALRDCGVLVAVIGEPVDLLTWYRGKFLALEVKTPGEPKHSKKRCERQDAFIAATGCPVVKTVSEALTAVLGVF
jgi:hypothetical protein